MLPSPFDPYPTQKSMDYGSLATNLGSIGSGLFGLFNNPADAAIKYSNQVPETVTPYYQPYIDRGLRAGSSLEEQYNMLLNNPELIMQMLGGSFEQSPGYQWQVEQAMNAANNAAAAGGGLGGTAHQQNAMNTATNLANQDYYNYLDRNTALYQTGLQGQQGLNAMGYGASDALASLLAQSLMNQAMLSGLGKMNQNSSSGSLIGGVTGAVGDVMSIF